MRLQSTSVLVYLHGDYASVHYNGWFLHDIILLRMLTLFFFFLCTINTIGYCNPIKSHEEFLSLHTVFPSKRFDNFSPLIGWMPRRFRCVQIFLHYKSSTDFSRIGKLVK